MAGEDGDEAGLAEAGAQHSIRRKPLESQRIFERRSGASTVAILCPHLQKTASAMTESSFRYRMAPFAAR
jgi:hypothetical protein